MKAQRYGIIYLKFEYFPSIERISELIASEDVEQTRRHYANLRGKRNVFGIQVFGWSDVILFYRAEDISDLLGKKRYEVPGEGRICDLVGNYGVDCWFPEQHWQIDDLGKWKNETICITHCKQNPLAQVSPPIWKNLQQKACNVFGEDKYILPAIETIGWYDTIFIFHGSFKNIMEMLCEIKNNRERFGIVDTLSFIGRVVDTTTPYIEKRTEEITSFTRLKVSGDIFAVSDRLQEAGFTKFPPALTTGECDIEIEDYTTIDDLFNKLKILFTNHSINRVIDTWTTIGLKLASLRRKNRSETTR